MFRSPLHRGSFLVEPKRKALLLETHSSCPLNYTQVFVYYDRISYLHSRFRDSMFHIVSSQMEMSMRGRRATASVFLLCFSVWWRLIALCSDTFCTIEEPNALIGSGEESATKIGENM